MPLHLAIGWPIGVKVLIDANANINAMDTFRERPIQYACKQRMTESVRLLGEAGCEFFFDSDNWNEDESILDEAAYHEMTWRFNVPLSERKSQEEVTDLIINLLLSRRRELQWLVHRETSADYGLEKMPRTDRVLDEDVSLAYLLLTTHSKSIPASLQPPKSLKTVYHCSYLSIRIVSRLWHMGFRDIDSLDGGGETPLMILYSDDRDDLETYLELVCWFISKGANIHKKCGWVSLFECKGEELYWSDIERLGTESSMATVHFLARDVIRTIFNGFFMRMWSMDRSSPLQLLSKELLSLHNRSKEALAGILTDSLQDDCWCGCSRGSCRAFLHSLKTIMNDAGSLDNLLASDRQTWQAWCFKLAELLIEFLVNHFGHAHQIWESLSADIVRFLTFETLELRHICCRMIGTTVAQPKDCEDTRKIHDEDRLSLMLLEVLLLEFEGKYSEQPVPLIQFLNGYWKLRMKNVVQELDTMNEEHLLETGIVLHDHRNKSANMRRNALSDFGPSYYGFDEEGVKRLIQILG